MLAILSDAAWDAYDQGLEDGEEPRKGDLLLCKKLTVVSTTYGPSEERIKLRIEDLELTGNFRKGIGQPSPLLERASIRASREKIEDLRLKQLQSDAPAEDDHDEEDEHEEEEEENVSDDGHPEINDVGVSAKTANVLHDPVPADVTHSEKHSERPTGLSRMSSPDRVAPPDHTSPATRNTASTQLESQLPLEVTPTQAIQAPRNPIRRTRGGFSIGREGFEPTRGVNLTGPQAPTLHARQARLSNTPPKNKLLDVISKLPGQAPKKQSPEPAALISAQVVNENIVAETPTKAKRSSETSTAPESTPVSRKRYRIPRDQKLLLEHPSSWIPSAPGHQFPHPNVPIGLLTAWNAKATGATNFAPPESSPIPEIEQSSAVKSLHTVQAEPQATAAAEPGDDSDTGSEESDTSEDEPIDWSQSPSRSQVLPPDSSAAHTSPRVSRPGSRNTVQSGPEHMPISIVDDEGNNASTRAKSIAGSINRERELPLLKESVASQAYTDSDRVNSTPIVHKTQSSSHSDSIRDQSPRAPNTSQHPTETNAKHSSERAANIPPSSLRSPALRASSRSPATLLGSSDLHAEDAMARPAGWPDGRQPPGASQPISAGMERPQPLADNHYGPIRPSTQQTPDHVRRSLGPNKHVLPDTSPMTPLGAPTGPRGFRWSQHGTLDRRSNGSTSDQERAPSGDFYRPSPSQPREDRLSSGRNAPEVQRPRETQTPTSTIEMESAVPRALPPSKYRQERSHYYRNVQQRQW